MLNTDSKWRDLVASARISATTATTWTRTMRTIWCTLSQAGAIETKRIKILTRCGFNFLESFLLLKNQVVDLSLSRVSRSSPSTRETSFSGKQRTILFCWKKSNFSCVFRNEQNLRQLHTSPPPGALQHPDENLQEPSEPSESAGRAKEEEFFPTALAGGSRWCWAERGQGLTFEQPPGANTFSSSNSNVLEIRDWWKGEISKYVECWQIPLPKKFKPPPSLLHYTSIHI